MRGNDSDLIWLPSEEQAAADQYKRIKAARLSGWRVRVYKFLWYWKIGNLKAIHHKLRMHTEALNLEEEDQRITKILEPECVLFVRYLQDALSRLKFSDVERVEGKRKYRNKVMFEKPVYMTESAFYFRVRTTRKTALGARSMLPHGVQPSRLITDETLKDLSITLNRKVSGVYLPGRGLWFIIWRTFDMSGIPRLVSFNDMLEFFTPERPQLCLGIGENRQVHMVNLNETPHILVGGETGGGKSNTVNGFICELIRNNQPQKIKMILVDLKGGVEFSDYESIPHLARPIITNTHETLVVLQQALALIKLRYERMAKHRPRPKSLDQFNRKLPPEDRIPRLVIIIDEIGEILAAKTKSRDNIENLLIRICQLGRAAGVHVIAATQRPQKEIVSTAISANMTLKLAHKMARAADSMTILGTGDAAQLDPVPGRACYKQSWRVVITQPPFMRAEDIAGAVAVAQLKTPYDLVLPDPERAAELAVSEGQIVDYEAMLIRALTVADGRLSFDVLKQLFDMDRTAAAGFQAKVSGLTFDHESKRYQVDRHGNSYKINRVIIDHPAALKPEKHTNGKGKTKWIAAS